VDFALSVGGQAAEMDRVGQLVCRLIEPIEQDAQIGQV